MFECLWYCIHKNKCRIFFVNIFCFVSFFLPPLNTFNPLYNLFFKYFTNFFLNTAQLSELPSVADKKHNKNEVEIIRSQIVNMKHWKHWTLVSVNIKHWTSKHWKHWELKFYSKELNKQNRRCELSPKKDT